MKKHLLFITIAVILAMALVSCGGDDDDDSGGDSGDDDDTTPMDDDDDDNDNDTTPDDDDDDTSPGEPPAAPSDLIAAAQGSAEIRLEWADNSGNELGFTISRKEGSGNWAAIANAGRNVAFYDDASVECEKTYTYKVTAYNDAGESDAGNEAGDTTDYCEIVAPSDLVAVAISGSEMALSWTDNAFNATGFVIARRVFGDATWGEPIADITGTTYTDATVDCETNYQYRVKAYNTNASSQYSNIETHESGVCDLNAPTNLTATNNLAGQVNLAWSDNTNAETGYLVQRQSASSRGWQTIAELPMDSANYMDATVPCEDGDYEYRVLAYNGETISDPTNTATGSAYCPVDAPYGLIAEVTGTDSITLTWLCDADNITGFRVYGGTDELAELGTTNATTLEFAHDSLDCQTYYRYQVTSYSNNVESAPSPIASAQTDWCPVAAPTNVETEGDGNEVTVSWNHDLQYVTSFEIQRMVEGDDVWGLLDTVAAPDMDYIDGTVACYKQYQFRVKAKNQHVESDWSDEATGTATGCTPMRPRPVLVSSSPNAYIALSRDHLPNPPDPLYPLEISGEGIASDTKVEVGDYLLDCDTGGEGTDCQADGSGQPENCATICIVSLPDVIMRNADNYVIRLQTPDPVYQGQNTSSATRSLSVVAPLPEIVKLWPRGLKQYVDDSSNPIPQEIEVRVWAKNLMANALFRLEQNFGEVQFPGIIEDPETGNQQVRIKVSTQNIMPSDIAYEFAVRNPNPGGGERGTPFGVNPVIEDWRGSIATDILPTRHSGVFPQIWHQVDHLPKETLSTGLSWQGRNGWAALRNKDGELLARMPRYTSSGSLPLPIPSYQVDFQDRSGNKPKIKASDAPLLYCSGDGTFGAETVLSVGIWPESVDVADVNGDGKLDIIAANNHYDSDSVSILIGNGDGTFQPKVDHAIGYRPNDLTVLDIDGDGDLEIMVVNQYFDNVSIRLGAGDGTFGAETTITMGIDPVSLKTGDFDNDGNVDLVTANETSDDISIRLGNGDGTFQPKTDLSTGDSPRAVEVADLNLDGVTDIVTINFNENNLSIFLGIGDGTFKPKTDLAMPGNQYDLTISDLNVDGTPDIIVTNNLTGIPNDVSIRFGNGDGTFGQIVDWDMGDGINTVKVADLNGDSLPDLIAGSKNDKKIWLRFGVGNGALGEKTPIEMSESPYSLVVSDINNDGAFDFVTSNGNPNVSIFLGNGDEPFKPILIKEMGEMGSYPDFVEIADLDGDANLDIIALNNIQSKVMITLGLGNGDFGAIKEYVMGDRPEALVVKDINNDDIPDILALDESGDRRVSVRLGVGDGTFGVKGNVSLGYYAISISIGDINNDDVPDLVTGLQSVGAAIQIGVGNGTFNGPTLVTTGNRPAHICISDLNNDNANDIITANYNSDDVSILLGVGDGTFGDTTNIPVGDWLDDLAIGDIDNDGILDIAAANRFNAFSLLGVGDGTFGEVNEIEMGEAITFFTMEDIDNDGIIDLLSNSFVGNSVLSIRMGIKGDSFSPISVFPIPMSGNIKNVAVGDLDGDGTNDIVASNSYFPNITIRYLGIPGNWHQELTDSFSDNPGQPWLPKYATASSTTEIQIHQARQTITKVGAMVLLEWAEQPTGSVTLTMYAPDDESDSIELGTFSEFSAWPDDVNPTSWRFNKVFRAYDFQGETGITDFDDWLGLQPTGYWRLEINNQTGADAEVKNWTVLTDGHF